MHGFYGIESLERRQDASPGSLGSGESNTFLELIANPFVAAVCFSSQSSERIANLRSFKQTRSGLLSVPRLAPLFFLPLSSPSFVLDTLSSTLQRSNMQTQSMRLRPLRKEFSHG